MNSEYCIWLGQKDIQVIGFFVAGECVVGVDRYPSSWLGEEEGMK